MFGQMRTGSRLEANRVPVAVVMGLTAPGLALARSLGRAGVDVIGVSTAEDPPAAHSRLFGFRRAPSIGDPARLLGFYLALADELRRPIVLLPTGDQSVRFISAHRQELDPHFRYLLPTAEELDRITSKRRFSQLATEAGLPLPRTVLPAGREELEKVSQTLRFPCIVKPEFTDLWRTHAAREAGLGKTKAVPAADALELLARYEELALVDSALVVQEMVVGPDENHLDYHALVDQTGQLLAEFAGRKLRLTPPHFGAGSYVESIDAREVATEGRLVLERLGFRGMANMNFKRDERDGRLFLLELNPRFSNWTGLDISCGVDFAYLYFMACAGEGCEAPAPYRLGKRWVDFTADRESMKVYAHEGLWTWPAWAWSLARASVWALFAPDDPRPSWVSFRRWLRHDVLKA